MPVKKYQTDEERLEARRAAARRFYESHKDDEVFKIKNREKSKAYHELNKQHIAAKARIHYWSNEEYRNNKLDRSADRYINDSEYRQKTILAASKRYWDKRAAKLEAAEGITKSTGGAESPI